MKGLLVKDIRLILKQKTMLLAMAGICIFLFFYGVGLNKITTYLMLLVTVLTTNTIAQDSMDNGMAYLMTLPARRKAYVIEKYGLVTCSAFIMTLIVSAVEIIPGLLQKQETNPGGSIIFSMLGFFAVTLMAAVIIPLNLKYGAENGKIVVLALTVVIAATGSFLLQQEDGGLLEVIMDAVPVFATMGTGTMLGIISAAWFMLVGISMAVSVGIMKRKEY